MAPLGHLPHQASVHHIMTVRIRRENRQNVGRLDGDEAANQPPQRPRKTHFPPPKVHGLLRTLADAEARQSRPLAIVRRAADGCCRRRRPTTTVRSAKIFFDYLIGVRPVCVCKLCPPPIHGSMDPWIFGRLTAAGGRRRRGRFANVLVFPTI